MYRDGGAHCDTFLVPFLLHSDLLEEGLVGQSASCVRAICQAVPKAYGQPFYLQSLQLCGIAVGSNDYVRKNFDLSP